MFTWKNMLINVIVQYFDIFLLNERRHKLILNVAFWQNYYSMAILRILLIVFLKLKKIVNQESFVRPKIFIRNSAYFHNNNTIVTFISIISFVYMILSNLLWKRMNNGNTIDLYNVSKPLWSWSIALNKY